MKGTDRYRVEGVTCRLGDRTLRVVNMSVSGIFVECPDPPPQGTSVEVHLFLPGREPFSMVGPVAWVNDPARPRHASLPAGFGFRMQRVSFVAKMRILELLRERDPAALRDR